MSIFKRNRQQAIIASSCVVILIVMLILRRFYMYFIYTSASIKDDDIFDADQVRKYANGWILGEDKGFIRYIRSRWLVKPSKRAVSEMKKTRVKLGPKRKVDFSEYGQSIFIDKQLGKLENGFFVECGAYNGINASNTFFFEEVRNWTGLLIEGSQNLFKKLLLSGRNAYMINACLNTEASSAQVTFLDNGGGVGGIKDKVPNAYVIIHSNVFTWTPQPTKYMYVYTLVVFRFVLLILHVHSQCVSQNLSIRVDLEMKCLLNPIYFSIVYARWTDCEAHRLFLCLICVYLIQFGNNISEQTGFVLA